MKNTTLYKLLGYAALLVVLYFFRGAAGMGSSIQSTLVFLAGGSLMYWGVMFWMYGMEHRNDPPQDESEDERKQLTGPRKPRKRA